MKLTTLDALLLFLIAHKGQSGYEVRQLFQATPLGIYSDSPGAIYPALARLERRGLMKSAAQRSGRRKRSYGCTAAGDKALRAWLEEPVDPVVYERRPQELELRYVMIAETLGRARALAFLRRWLAVDSARLADLNVYIEGAGAGMSRAAREALDLGLRQLRARVAWASELAHSGGKTS